MSLVAGNSFTKPSNSALNIPSIAVAGMSISCASVTTIPASTFLYTSASSSPPSLSNTSVTVAGNYTLQNAVTSFPSCSFYGDINLTPSYSTGLVNQSILTVHNIKRGSISATSTENYLAGSSSGSAGLINNSTGTPPQITSIIPPSGGTLTSTSTVNKIINLKMTTAAAVTPAYQPPEGSIISVISTSVSSKEFNVNGTTDTRTLTINSGNTGITLGSKISNPPTGLSTDHFVIDVSVVTNVTTITLNKIITATLTNSKVFFKLASNYTITSPLPSYTSTTTLVAFNVNPATSMAYNSSSNVYSAIVFVKGANGGIGQYSINVNQTGVSSTQAVTNFITGPIVTASF
jgi:hypothetical protein